MRPTPTKSMLKGSIHPKEKIIIKKKNKRRLTQDNILEAQCKALILNQENLKLKKRKLGFEVFLLEQRSCLIPIVLINISP